MSLNVYLEGEEAEVKCVCSDCYHEHTRKSSQRYFDGNITHNLGSMASAVPIGPHGGRPAATLYAYLWRATEPLEPHPEIAGQIDLPACCVSWSGNGGLGIERARDMIEPLAEGLAKLEADPEAFKQHNPPNGWGSYDGLVRLVRAYLAACREWPDANVSVSR